MATSPQPHGAAQRSALIYGALALLILGRLLLQLLLYRSGFIALSADEFGRTVMAASWAQAPYLLWRGAWLPLHMYLFGIALKFSPELLWVPRAIAIGLGAISIPLMYALTNNLLKNRTLALISAFLLAVNPAFLWLSAAPLTAAPQIVLLLAAILSMVLYLTKEQLRFIYLGSFMLLLANGFRFEAWVFSVLFCLALVINGIRVYRRGTLDAKHISALTIGIALPWFFPVGWMIGSFLESGNPMGFMDSVQTYKSAWYGPDRSYRNYLTTFWTVDPFATILALLGLGLCALQGWRSAAMRWYIAVAIVPLLIFAITHGGQVEPPGNYYRYLLLYVVITYPAVANLIGSGCERIARNRTANRILLTSVLLIIGVIQIETAFHYVNDPASSGLAVGQRIRALRADEPVGQERPVLIEVAYWQYLAIHVGANDLDKLLHDRLLDFNHRQTASLLETDPEAVRNCLIRHDVSYIVVSTPELRHSVEDNLGLSPLEEVNGYAIYPVPDQLVEGASSAQPACPLSFDSGY